MELKGGYWFEIGENVKNGDGSPKLCYCRRFEDVLTAHGVQKRVKEKGDAPVQQPTTNVELLRKVEALAEEKFGNLTAQERTAVMLYQLQQAAEPIKGAKWCKMVKIHPQSLSGRLKPLRMLANQRHPTKRQAWRHYLKLDANRAYSATPDTMKAVAGLLEA